ncbi:hypothetical protein [Clostridium botulinum]|uniref:Uncharacterized protein n=1 Tax=Clostridium botulinum (strain Kyoto / Type A2) TaxID=536232 RepID=C1FPD7_CLOBJ|nr:hypothetical protein [Clostridium botulinum]ACO85358.1 conserved hypothetical protein [Clostridium botulinum A2 str. Kyoto]APQ72298.1 hypothetical protein RSJ9_2307 [Clostridium botulinum]APQ96992.1 hypothetical protein RSJ3_1930 [Clostridium botulinum]EPS56240.1 hypothetical protein CLQ_12113 [Clostridium botulinum Af84]
MLVIYSFLFFNTNSMVRRKRAFDEISNLAKIDNTESIIAIILKHSQYIK